LPKFPFREFSIEVITYTKAFACLSLTVIAAAEAFCRWR
jgi:hypothetical protein